MISLVAYRDSADFIDVDTGRVSLPGSNNENLRNQAGEAAMQLRVLKFWEDAPRTPDARALKPIQLLPLPVTR